MKRTTAGMMQKGNNMDSCFASSDDGCRILTKTKCSGCTFRKTRAQVISERAQSIQRLKTLGIWEYYKAKYALTELGVPMG